VNDGGNAVVLRPASAQPGTIPPVVATHWTCRRLAGALTLLCLLPAAAAGAASGGASALEPCKRSPVLRCASVTVPLDRSGRVPGTVTLGVEVLPAAGTERGVMFLIPGGPGQGGIGSFDLADDENASFYRSLAPGYTLVTYDARGTGRSGPLRCPMVSLGWPDDAKELAACARALGARRDFYGTADHAEDLDAVRHALGYRTIALAGVSYGTQLSVAYALAHPRRVERLLLDSVAVPDGQDPFIANLLSRMPSALRSFCANGDCRAATPDFAADVVAVANAFAAKPLRVRAHGANGTVRTRPLDGLRFLSLVFDADLSPGLAAELPAVVHAARAGDTRPLLRLLELTAANEGQLYADLNVGLYVATLCRDGPFPWQARTPIPDRRKLVTAALAALPAGEFGPFGRWAGRGGVAASCVDWPAPAGGATLGKGPLPDVPVLALSGRFDLRTPTADAAAIVARFPQGRLLVVPGIGHSVLTSDPSGCAEAAVREWMAGGHVPRSCPRPRAYLDPIGAYATGSEAPARPAGPRRTLELAAKTLHEAEATWLYLAVVTSKRTSVPGLRGGKLTVSADTFKLDRYSIEPGVTLSGEVVLRDVGPPLSFRGRITVGGRGASPGTLELGRGGTMQGILGGTFVEA
jgi:pimeloyl-ACP methyl ester carboxylesterase